MNERTIFMAALDIDDSAERWAYLDESCRGNPNLRKRVEALIHSHEQAVSFLNSPPPGIETTDIRDTRPVTEVPGETIGPYKLLQQIGEGGMGVVFMAEQTEPIQRTVALKIIKPGMDTRQVIARFEAERQAVAMMDHPNIARVIDAGTTATGRPYFVMDLVKGVPITDYCDQQHLTVRQRLELVSAVCHAVQHAHQKGIIHRDLKPSNVLVAEYDGKPVPKIIDFGVAKATAQRLTEKTMFTELGQMVGTLEYMSPEQSRFNQLDIDTRSDIYSLGVLVYELLTGSTPFGRKRLNEAAFDEMLRIIREEEPPKPSTRLSSSDALPSIAANRGLEPLKLNRLVQGELDWIVMKALEKDRNRRYETASGLGQDIACYLDDEPVQACPPSTGYRLKKFLRRNKGPALAAAVLLLALIVGVTGTTWGMVRAEQQRQLAALSAQKALAAAEVAQTREAETEAILEFVENKVFGATRPEGDGGGLGHDVTLRRAVEAALPFVGTSFADQPLIEARLRMMLGTSFLQLGDARIAAEQFETARALLSQHLGTDHPRTVECTNDLANCYADLGRYTDALKLREETLTVWKTKLGLDHRLTLCGMHNLALSYADLGKHFEALKLLEDSQRRRMSELGPDHPDTLANMTVLANCYRAVGRFAEALKLQEETLALKKATLGSDHPDTLASMINLANSYADLGRHTEALNLRDETLALQKAELGPDHPDTLMSMHNLANSYCDLGRHTEALKLREETLALAKAKLGLDHPNTLANMVNLAGSYNTVGRYDDAVKLSEKTFELSRVKLGPDHPTTVGSMNQLAWALATNADPMARNPGRAIELARSAVELSPKEKEFRNTLGAALYRTGDWPAAIKALEKAMELRNGGDSKDFYFLAMAYWQLGHKDKAHQWYDQGVDWMEKNSPSEELRRFRDEAEELLGITEPHSSIEAKPPEAETQNSDNPTPTSPLNPKP